MEKIKKKILASISIVLMIGCATFLSGCTTQKETVGTGTIRLLITDKKTDLDIIHAYVKISMVQIHKADSTNNDDEEDDTDDTDEEGFIANANGEYKGDVGEDIQFLGSASGGQEPYNWSWNFGDGSNISYEQNPLHNYSAEGVFTVNLTVKDNTSTITWDETIARIGQEENESDAGWYTIVNETQTFDLIALEDVNELLGEKNLTAGKYTQIRLTIESANITINASGTIEEHDLVIPSEKIKLIKSFSIIENETTILTLDFDVYESVHKAGNKYIMKPTIKVIEG